MARENRDHEKDRTERLPRKADQRDDKPGRKPLLVPNADVAGAEDVAACLEDVWISINAKRL